MRQVGPSNIRRDLLLAALLYLALVANGDFSRSGNRRFFLTDDYSAWRIENVWLQTLFDQGTFGLAAFTLLTLYLLLQLPQETRKGDAVAASLLASFAGILAVGMFGSVLDFPRISPRFFLFLSLVLAYLEAGGRKGQSHRASA